MLTKEKETIIKLAINSFNQQYHTHLIINEFDVQELEPNENFIRSYDIFKINDPAHFHLFLNCTFDSKIANRVGSFEYIRNNKTEPSSPYYYLAEALLNLNILYTGSSLIRNTIADGIESGDVPDPRRFATAKADGAWSITAPVTDHFVYAVDLNGKSSTAMMRRVVPS
jgi:hypothetical protein